MLDFMAVETMSLGIAQQHGCTQTLEAVIVRLVRFVEAEEGRRGQVVRSERSTLSENGGRCQLILDKLMLILLGLGADWYEYIKDRLEYML